MSEKTPATPESDAAKEGAPAVEPVDSLEPHGEALILPPEPQSVRSTDSAVGAPAVEPTVTESSTPESPADSTTVVEPVDSHTVDDEVDYGPVETSDDAEADRAPEAVAKPAPTQTVYVHAPVPPRKRGNRGIGSLIALGSAIIFGAIYAVVVLAITPLFAPPRAVGFEFLGFLTSAAFFVPVLVFAVVFILLVLLLNRANWWAYILGSLFVGVLVYFVSIGILLLVNGVVGLTPSAAARAFRAAAQSPVIVAGALVAREVSLWMGAAVAARGRRVRARNAEDRAAFDRDTARARAEYERAVAANAAQ
ncbi:hypothetical protein [Parafrigoribacterium soli]|uniref:hypothetical protein n=1 Tax=Parafrigoribacterium soli TaxID=3144663 RepID=UPI0032EBBD1C